MSTSRRPHIWRADKFLKLAAICVALVGVWLAPTRNAEAQTAYPSQPIKILVGFPASTIPDTLARLVGEKLQQALGQPVVIENVAGAGGNIAAHLLAKAEPDGYTLSLSGNAPVVIQQSLMEKLPYDPVKDLAPISQLVTTPLVLAVTPGLAARTPKELAELARAQPHKLIYGHSGIGTGTHLAPEMFNKMESISIRALAYRGAVTPDLLAGRVEMCFCVVGSAIMPLVHDGKLRALAVTTRLSTLPDVPTMADAGYPGFELTTPWFALMAPGRTPGPIVERLHQEAVKALAQADVRGKLTALGMGVIGNSPQEFAAAIKAEIPFWEKLITQIGLKRQ
jgi:tripartite-type tricarboxylate transporter receptor subunit TctC